MINRNFPSTRLRRTRAKSFLRDLVAENKLSSDDLIQPIFVADQKESQLDIPSMPGIFRHNLDSLYSEAEALLNAGVKSIAIFPYYGAFVVVFDYTGFVDESASIVGAITGVDTADKLAYGGSVKMYPPNRDHP